MNHILDTSVLVAFWRKCRAGLRRELTTAVAQSWARNLMRLYENPAIVTPVSVEFLAGVCDGRELRATQAFLNEIPCADAGSIPKRDWQEAIRVAQRIPRKPHPRQMGDCLIRAIANRLKHQVVTIDRKFAE